MLTEEQIQEARRLSDEELDRDANTAIQRWRQLLKAGKLKPALKHLAGRHNQRRHGWRFGGGIPSGLEGEELAEYTRRRESKKPVDMADRPFSETQAFKKFGRGSGAIDPFGEDMYLAALARERGFIKVPSLVSDIDESSNIVVWRGVSEAKYAEQFRTGDYFAGQGIYGNGTYTTTSVERAKSYAA